MKHNIYSLLLLLFIMCTASTFVVNADTATASAITDAAKATLVTVNKTVKVNSTLKAKKTLKLNTATVKNYKFATSNKKVAKVSKKGNVKALKKGSATISVKLKSTSSVVANINVKVKAAPAANTSNSDLRLLASIIYSEAGNQCYAGKQAVGIVIVNRVRSRSFPNSVNGVVYQSGQFTPARNGSLNRSLSLYDSGKLNKDCIKAAKDALSGNKTVSYGGRSINMNNYLFFSGYVSGARLTIQDHMFK